jgi:hypothetical protein
MPSKRRIETIQYLTGEEMKALLAAIRREIRAKSNSPRAETRDLDLGSVKLSDEVQSRAERNDEAIQASARDSANGTVPQHVTPVHYAVTRAL